MQMMYSQKIRQNLDQSLDEYQNVGESVRMSQLMQDQMGITRNLGIDNNQKSIINKGLNMMLGSMVNEEQQNKLKSYVKKVMIGRAFMRKSSYLNRKDSSQYMMRKGSQYMMRKDSQYLVKRDSQAVERSSLNVGQNDKKDSVQMGQSIFDYGHRDSGVESLVNNYMITEELDDDWGYKIRNEEQEELNKKIRDLMEENENLKYNIKQIRQ